MSRLQKNQEKAHINFYQIYKQPHTGYPKVQCTVIKALGIKPDDLKRKMQKVAFFVLEYGQNQPIQDV